MPALLSTSNVRAAGFAVLAVGIAPIPCKAQALFFLWILNGAHAATFQFCAEYATAAERLKMKVSRGCGLWFLDRRAQVV
jgi:hypothetical protein